MKRYLWLFIILMSILISNCNKKETKSMDVQPSQLMEVACGECMFGLPGDDCDLAVRFDGKAYFVTGTGIDDHGDAHADDGLCNTIRQAEVKGELTGESFHVTELKLL